MAAGGLGLLLEGTERPAHLAELVGETLQVRLGAGKAAQSLLLAQPVGGHTRGFLEDGAPLGRLGVEDGVDTALRDDHVAVAAHSGGGKQFGDVDQAGRRGVDGVAAVTAAEQRARDRHLVEVHRQPAVLVVQRQRHLRPPKRRPSRVAGEDHVVHLLRAQRRGRLRAEHPGDGVDDIGLAAAVGADDHRQAGSEIDRRRLRERLESLQREGFQEHAYTWDCSQK